MLLDLVISRLLDKEILCFSFFSFVLIEVYCFGKSVLMMWFFSYW